MLRWTKFVLALGGVVPENNRLAAKEEVVVVRLFLGGGDGMVISVIPSTEVGESGVFCCFNSNWRLVVWRF